MQTEVLAPREVTRVLRFGLPVSAETARTNFVLSFALSRPGNSSTLPPISLFLLDIILARHLSAAEVVFPDESNAKGSSLGSILVCPGSSQLCRHASLTSSRARIAVIDSYQGTPSVVNFLI